jgi:hypothetical protein
MNTSSHRRIVARGLVAEVEHCADCELMHLHIGAFTLRLKPSVLHDLRDTLNRAIAMLPAHSPEDKVHQAAGAQPPDGTCH